MRNIVKKLQTIPLLQNFSCPWKAISQNYFSAWKTITCMTFLIENLKLYTLINFLSSIVQKEYIKQRIKESCDQWVLHPDSYLPLPTHENLKFPQLPLYMVKHSCHLALWSQWTYYFANAPSWVTTNNISC